MSGPRPVPACFAPVITPLAHKGHWSVKGTEHWVSRHFDDGFAVVSPSGEIVEVLYSLEAAARVAVEYRPAPTWCKHCERTVVLVDGVWSDLEAEGDDEHWRVVCDAVETFTAEHEPMDPAR